VDGIGAEVFDGADGIYGGGGGPPLRVLLGPCGRTWIAPLETLDAADGVDVSGAEVIGVD